MQYQQHVALNQEGCSLKNVTFKNERGDGQSLPVPRQCIWQPVLKDNMRTALADSAHDLED